MVRALLMSWTASKKNRAWMRVAILGCAVAGNVSATTVLHGVLYSRIKLPQVLEQVKSVSMYLALLSLCDLTSRSHHH